MNATPATLVRWCLLVLACAVLAAPGAQAMHAPQDSVTRVLTPAPTHVTVDVSSSDGFSWADAGVGAAGALGVVLLLVGVGIPARRNHKNRLAALRAGRAC